MATTPEQRVRDDEPFEIQDELIRQSEAGRANSGARNLFDLRTIIGALFTLYGLFLVVLGIFDTEAEVTKAAGVRINLWAGLGMLALGIVFLLWVRLRPLRIEELVQANAADATDELELDALNRGRGAAPGH